nr:probable N-acetyltransferase CML1 [Cavia porcellus]XP_005003407.1 probable N-acetyltransferase CML1 [Cavia porcellus]XP_023420545.1 probable N-acetyltransferase CML1 [Cavia porcellus]XP_023420546.1 probable N-acetyltransferase CML1 [Cavia porcellus]
MAPYHIRTFQEKDQTPVMDLYSSCFVEHVPAAIRHALMLPRNLLLEVGVALFVFLVSGSWLLAVISILILLLFLCFLVRYMWKHAIVICLRTDMADITKTYLSAHDSCFWVAESGGQVVGIVSALLVANPPLGKKQLKLFHLAVAMEHRGEGIAKALVRTVLQFARDQGYGEVVLDTTAVQHSALGLYQGMGFRKTGQFFESILWKLTGISWIRLIYHLPSARDGGL